MKTHTVTNTEAVEVIKSYTANLKAAEPMLSAEVVNLTVAAVFTGYVAAAIIESQRRHSEAETILNHAASYLMGAAV